NLKTMLGVDDLGQWVTERADQNGDGGLSVEEFAASNPQPILRAFKISENGELIEQPVENLVFNSIDADKDGLLSADELSAQMTSETGGRPRFGFYSNGVDAMISASDQDGDGALSMPEISMAAEAMNAPNANPAQLHKDADADRDGRVTKAEFETMI